jgi:hypothetical protein
MLAHRPCYQALISRSRRTIGRLYRGYNEQIACYQSVINLLISCYQNFDLFLRKHWRFKGLRLSGPRKLLSITHPKGPCTVGGVKGGLPFFAAAARHGPRPPRELPPT